MTTEERRQMLEQEVCARSQGNSEDADYIGCALAELEMATTDRELRRWIREYATLIGPAVIIKALERAS